MRSPTRRDTFPAKVLIDIAVFENRMLGHILTYCAASALVLLAALDLSEKQPDFAAKGVKLVGVVHEKLGVEEFSEFFKNGEIYFDEEKAFFNGETEDKNLFSVDLSSLSETTFL